MQEIQSNTQLQQQLSQLMGALANAYAKSLGGSGTSTGGAGTGTGNLFNQASNLLNPNSGPNVSQAVSGANAGATQLGAGGASALAGDSTGVDAQLAAGAATPASGSYAGLAGGGYGDLTDASGSVISSGADLTAEQGIGDAVGSDAASIGSDVSSFLGFNSGGAAAGATGTGLTAADLTTVPGASELGISTIGDTGAASGAAGAAALGPALGAAAGVAGVLAPALIGMETPAVSVGAKYWSNFDDGSTPGSPQYEANSLQISNLLAQGEQVPEGILALYPDASAAAVANTGVIPYGTGGGPGTRSQNRD
jgi:hypothetical protein